MNNQEILSNKLPQIGVVARHSDALKQLTDILIAAGYTVEHANKDGLIPADNASDMILMDAKALADIRQAVEALKTSEERLRYAMEGTDVGLWDVKMKTNEVYMSPRGCELLDYRPDELHEVVKVWDELVNPEDLPLTNERLSAYLQGDAPIFEVEQRLRTKSGDWKWILARGKAVEWDENHNPLRMTGTHKDITRQKNAEKEIWRLNAELEQKVIERTSELEEINTILEEEIAERQKIEEEIRVLNNALENKIEKRTNQLMETNMVLEETNALLEEEIVEHERMEAELIKAKELAEAANLAKSQFLANMSHEIRTPMNGIMGMTELTLMTELQEEQRHYLNLAKKSTHSLLRIIDDVLDYSKIEAGKVQIENKPFKVMEILNEVIALFDISAKQKNLQIIVDSDMTLSDVLNGDAVRIRQVLSNLLGNAVKFTHQGSITITVRRSYIHSNKVELKFSVKDTGIGIPLEKQGALFERFNQLDSSYTKQYQGTGLGLAISRKLIELMGGKIWVESDGINGSTFIYTIVVESANENNWEKWMKTWQINAKEKDTKGRSSKKVLVVEDDEVSRYFIKTLLKKDHIDITTAENGEFAIEALSGQAFDLILMDIQMPVLDGLAATQLIRENEKLTGMHIPIIAMTAYALEGDREKMLAAGMDDYISKPIDAEEIIFKTGLWLDKSN